MPHYSATWLVPGGTKSMPRSCLVNPELDSRSQKSEKVEDDPREGHRLLGNDSPRYEDILALKIGLTLRATDDGSAFFSRRGRGNEGL